MIINIRKHVQSWGIKILLGVIIFTFVVSFGVGQFTDPGDLTLATVGDQQIMISEYQMRYGTAMRSLQVQLGQQAEQYAQSIGLRNTIYEQLVEEKVLEQAALDRGLQVLDSELAQSIADNPSFQLDGRFDAETYETVLAHNGFSVGRYEDSLRRQMLIDKYREQSAIGTVVNDFDIQWENRFDTELVVLNYFPLAFSKFADKVEISADEIQQYYDNNTHLFRTTEEFKIDYVVLNLETLKQKTNVTTRAIEIYYDRNKDNLYTDQAEVQARHILKKIDHNTTAEERQAKREELQAVLDKLNQNPEQFAALAKTESDDSTAEDGGDLGWFDRNQMVSGFSDVAFSLDKGQISGIVETEYGLHIIEVIDKRPEYLKPLSEVSDEVQNTIAEQRAERLLQDLAPQFRAGEIDLAQLTADYGVEPKSSDWFSAETSNSELGSMAEIAAQLTSATPGSSRVLVRNAVQGYVFYVYKENEPSEVKSLEQVTDDIRQILTTEKSRELALDEAEKIKTEVKTSQDFARIGREYDENIATARFTFNDDQLGDLGAFSELQRKAFSLTEESPITYAVRGEDVYLSFLNERVFLSLGLEESTRDELEQRLIAERQEYLRSRDLHLLMDKYPVEILLENFL